MVLDMGLPVKIVDVARELIKMSGRSIDIQFTGLRPGEKLTEVLFTAGETHLRTDHPLMTAVDVPAMDPTYALWPAEGKVSAVSAQLKRGALNT